MKKIIIAVIIAASMFFSLTAQEKKETLKGELKIAGGTAHIEVMKAIAEIMMNENPDLKISISGGGSGLGIKQVGEGLIDIGNSGRPVKESEVKEFGLEAHAIAIDGLVVTVHPKSTVKVLSFKQIQDIFSGKITNWKEVGGKDAKINVYTRDKESGTRQTFEELAMGKDAKIMDTANFVKSNGNMKVLVSGDENAIGYMSVGYMDSSVKGVEVDGVEPSVENIKNGKYKVQRSLFSVTKGEAKGLAKAFIERVLSKEGQTIVKAKGFLTVK